MHRMRSLQSVVTKFRHSELESGTDNCAHENHWNWHERMWFTWSSQLIGLFDSMVVVLCTSVAKFSPNDVSTSRGYQAVSHSSSQTVSHITERKYDLSHTSPRKFQALYWHLQIPPFRGWDYGGPFKFEPPLQPVLQKRSLWCWPLRHHWNMQLMKIQFEILPNKVHWSQSDEVPATEIEWHVNCITSENWNELRQQVKTKISKHNCETHWNNVRNPRNL